METFKEFLKKWHIREVKFTDKKKKIHLTWIATEKGVEPMFSVDRSGLDKAAVIWELERTYESLKLMELDYETKIMGEMAVEICEEIDQEQLDAYDLAIQMIGDKPTIKMDFPFGPADKRSEKVTKETLIERRDELVKSLETSNG